MWIRIVMTTYIWDPGDIFVSDISHHVLIQLTYDTINADTKILGV